MNFKHLEKTIALGELQFTAFWVDDKGKEGEAM